MKSVSGYCVRQRRLLSNPVTYVVCRSVIVFMGAYVAIADVSKGDGIII